MQRTASTLTSFQRLEQRIAAQLSCPLVRLQRYVLIRRRADESLEDWEQLRQQLDLDASIRVTPHADAVEISWGCAYDC